MDVEGQAQKLNGMQMEHTDMPLKNKVAMVTGSAGAIGCGVCKGLLEAGAFLAASDLPGERLDELTQDLEQIAPNRVLGVPLDVTDAASIEKAFETIGETFGGYSTTKAACHQNSADSQASNSHPTTYA